MSRVRPAAVTGVFYPADPEALRTMVDRLLSAAAHHTGAEVAPPRARLPAVPTRAGECSATGPGPDAMVVPHQGYQYSGPIAASAYARLLGQSPAEALLLGPSHFVAFDGCALPSADAFATPLGQLPVSDRLRQAVAPHARVLDGPHRQEHSLEVQLPFLQVLGVRAVLLVAVGRCAPEQVADIIAASQEAADTGAAARSIVIVSTDLSHYHDPDTARALDLRTCERIGALDPSGIRDSDACGAYPLRGPLAHAKRASWRPRLLDLRNSGDTSGEHRSVVGYGAFEFTRTEGP